jgi:hypothetical protein
MKTTLDLPDALVKQVKLRALNEGQKLKDAVADLLRIGLAAVQTNDKIEAAVITRDKETGLPVIECKHSAKLTPEDVANILLQQEVEWFNAARR